MKASVRAKRGWGGFGAQPARSETPVRAADERRPSRKRAQRSEQAETNEMKDGTGIATLVAVITTTMNDGGGGGGDGGRGPGVTSYRPSMARLMERTTN